MAYINEIKKNQTIYDIQDKRISEVNPLDVGKVLAAKGDGSFELIGSCGIDLIQLAGRFGSTQYDAFLNLYFIKGELESHSDILNQGINSLNDQFGLSIPAMTDLNSLIDIFDYVGSLGNDAIYNAAAAGFFGWVNIFLLSSRIWVTGSNTNANIDPKFITDVNTGTYSVAFIDIDDHGFTFTGSVNIEGTEYPVSVDGTIPEASYYPVFSSQQNSKFRIFINDRD